MKRRCDHCRGKGGWTRQAGRFLLYVSCAQCKGKGSWYDSKKPQAKKQKR